MTNLHISSLWKNLTNRTFSLGENIQRDWIIILSVFAFLSLVMLGMSTYLFLKVNQGEFFVTPQNNTRSIENLNRSRLEKTGEKLKERALKFEEARNDYSVVDPSS